MNKQKLSEIHLFATATFVVELIIRFKSEQLKMEARYLSCRNLGAAGAEAECRWSR